MKRYRVGGWRDNDQRFRYIDGWIHTWRERAREEEREREEGEELRVERLVFYDPSQSRPSADMYTHWDRANKRQIYTVIRLIVKVNKVARV